MSSIYRLHASEDSATQSTHDLIRRGISEGEVTCLPQSAISDPGQIRSTLHDTLAVCFFILRQRAWSP